MILPTSFSAPDSSRLVSSLLIASLATLGILSTLTVQTEPDGHPRMCLSDARAQLNQLGSWSAASLWPSGGPGYGAANLALVRGRPGVPNASSALYFHQGNHGRLGHYDPFAGNFTDNQDLDDHPMHHRFCGGHSFLADGKLLVAGGLVESEIGPRDAATFDARTETWSTIPDLLSERYYPTCVTLGDGRVMSVAGTRYRRMIMAGGTNGTTVHDELHRANLAEAPYWAGLLFSPFTDSSPSDPGEHLPNYCTYPVDAFSPREGLAMVTDGYTYAYGGNNGTTYPTDVWRLVRHDEHKNWETDENLHVREKETWFWCKEALDPGSAVVPGRTRHSAVVMKQGSDRWLVVFGGKLADGWVDDRVWAWRINTPHLWVEIQYEGDAPGPRFGHTAVALDGLDEPMILYGGWEADNVLGNEHVYELSIDFGKQYGWWTRIPTSGGIAADRRADHGTILNYDAPAGFKYRMVTFGGMQPSAGSFAATNNLREFRRSLSATQGSWAAISTNPPTAPSPRSRHSACYDNEMRRLVVYGGIDAGGPDNEMWSVDLDGVTGNPNLCQWVVNTNGPGARYGHAVVYDGAGIQARYPEILNSGHTAWEQIPHANPRSRGPKVMPFYPNVFQMPNGSILWTGANSSGYNTNTPVSKSYVLNLGDTDKRWRSADISPQADFDGGASVMYRPGKIMKCGSPYYPFTPLLADRDKTAVFDAATMGWTPTEIMPQARAFHNLTILPTGDVLMTGGNNGNPNQSLPDPDSIEYFNEPHLWSPASQEWSTPLAEEKVNGIQGDRGYHSTAILMPDGRVLTAGGAPSPDHAYVFTPPYLYNAQGQLTTDRPVITCAQGNIAYGASSTFWLTSPQAATSGRRVVLIRSGSATHGFNSDQRYIECDIQNVTGQTMTCTAPIDGNLAPPGDYLLFLVKTDAPSPQPVVPSVARWVTVGGPDQVPPSTIADLSLLACTPNSLTVGWTEPGDDENCGTVLDYEMRRSSSPINDANWNSATLVNTYPAGTTTAQATHLSGCTWYYIAIRARDDASNWTGVSNNVFARTRCGSQVCLTGENVTGIVDGGDLPTRLQLGAPIPNPAWSSVRMDYDLSTGVVGQTFELAVYDIAGRKCRVLSGGTAKAGRFEASWDLRDDSGLRARSGVYWLRLKAGGETESRQVTVR